MSEIAAANTDRLTVLRKARETNLATGAASWAAFDKSIFAAAGGGLAVTTTAVGMLVGRGVSLPSWPVAMALVGFGTCILSVVLSHQLAAKAAALACEEIDREIAGETEAACTDRFNGPILFANRVSGLALVAGLAGLVWIIMAAAQVPPSQDGGVRGTPVPKIEPRPAPPKPQPTQAPKPS